MHSHFYFPHSLTEKITLALSVIVSTYSYFGQFLDLTKQFEVWDESDAKFCCYLLIFCFIFNRHDLGRQKGSVNFVLKTFAENVILTIKHDFWAILIQSTIFPLFLYGWLFPMLSYELTLPNLLLTLIWKHNSV